MLCLIIQRAPVLCLFIVYVTEVCLFPTLSVFFSIVLKNMEFVSCPHLSHTLSGYCFSPHALFLQFKTKIKNKILNN